MGFEYYDGLPSEVRSYMCQMFAEHNAFMQEQKFLPGEHVCLNPQAAGLFEFLLQHNDNNNFRALQELYEHRNVVFEVSSSESILVDGVPEVVYSLTYTMRQLFGRDMMLLAVYPERFLYKQ